MPRKSRIPEPPQPEPALEPVLAEPLPETIEAPARPPLEQLEFFDHLRMMPARDWDERICYLYRGGNDIVKADPAKSKFIDKISGPFDESWVKEKFGGGRYLAILKNLKLGDAERKHSFEIDGQPRLQPDEVRRQSPNGATADVSTGSPSADQLIEKLVGQAVEAWKGRALEAETAKTGGPDDDAVAIMADSMRRACQAAIEIVKDARPAAVAAGDPLQQVVQIVSMLKQLGVVSDRRPNPAPSLRETFTELKEALGVDVSAILAGGGRGGADWRSALVQQVPSILSTAKQALGVWQAQTQASLQLAAQRAAAAAQPAAPDAAAAPPSAPAPARVLDEPPAPPAPAAFPSPGRLADGSLDLEWVKAFVLRQFDAGRAGEFAAGLLQEMFPDQAPLFAAAFGDAAQVMAFVRADPLLSAIVAAEGGEEFIREFAAEMQGEKAAPAA